MHVPRQRNRRGPEGKGAAVDPNVVAKQQDAVVGQWAFKRCRQVGSVGHVENDGGRGGIEVELSWRGRWDGGVLPPRKAEGCRQIASIFRLAQVEGDGPRAARVGLRG